MIALDEWNLNEEPRPWPKYPIAFCQCVVFVDNVFQHSLQDDSIARLIGKWQFLGHPNDADSVHWLDVKIDHVQTVIAGSTADIEHE